MMLSGGVLLFIIAILLGVVQHWSFYNIYGDRSNQWYFWAVVAIIGLIGIALVIWAYMKKEKAPAATT